MTQRSGFIQVLAAVLSVAWIGSLFVRAFLPQTSSAFIGLDTASVTVIGYYFMRRSTTRRNGGSL